MQQFIISGWKSDVNIEPKLELVTLSAYYIRFVVKLLQKCCECSFTLIFIESKFL